MVIVNLVRWRHKAFQSANRLTVLTPHSRDVLVNPPKDSALPTRPSLSCILSFVSFTNLELFVHTNCIGHLGDEISM